MHVYVLTCDKYDHLLPGFAYMFNKYWGINQTVKVLGFRKPPYQLPANFSFTSMEPVETLPWSTNVNNYFLTCTDDYFVLLLDDYWMVSPINFEHLTIVERVVALHGADKGDLSGNTHYFGYTKWDKYPGFLLANQTSMYRTSLQPAIWTRRYLLRLSRPGMNPWQFELSPYAGLDGRTIVQLEYGVPIYKYANMYYKGGFDGSKLELIKKEDLAELRALGYVDFIPK